MDEHNGTLRDLLQLEAHGPDTFVGDGLEYPWGGLYGGHIVAQALSAAARTVDEEFAVHSLRAYFIRRGDSSEPVRQEVDRIRNGRSFVTRRVVARQAVGAILNLEASFQREEDSADVQTLAAPDVPRPDELEPDSWSRLFDRRMIPQDRLAPPAVGAGRSTGWLRVIEDLGPAGTLQQRTAFAYLSDDLPLEAALRAHPTWGPKVGTNTLELFTASLDHTVWFHRPMRADAWHLHDFSCHTFIGGRGLTIGHVFDLDGVHVATVAQEIIARER